MAANKGCTCPDTQCKRHGNCELCKAYHASRSMPPKCQREPKQKKKPE